MSAVRPWERCLVCGALLVAVTEAGYAELRAAHEKESGHDLGYALTRDIF